MLQCNVSHWLGAFTKWSLQWVHWTHGQMKWGSTWFWWGLKTQKLSLNGTLWMTPSYMTPSKMVQQEIMSSKTWGTFWAPHWGWGGSSTSGRHLGWCHNFFMCAELPVHKKQMMSFKLVTGSGSPASTSMGTKNHTLYYFPSHKQDCWLGAIYGHKLSWHVVRIGSCSTHDMDTSQMRVAKLKFLPTKFHTKFSLPTITYNTTSHKFVKCPHIAASLVVKTGYQFSVLTKRQFVMKMAYSHPKIRWKWGV